MSWHRKRLSWYAPGRTELRAKTYASRRREVPLVPIPGR
jgi:hypothetical protein